MARKLTARQKRWLLSAHILLSSVWTGTASCFLVLNVVARGMHDDRLLVGIYTSISILDMVLIRPLAIGAAVTGVLLSVLTQWGLFRFTWIVTKLILTILLIATGIAMLGRLPASIISMISAGGLQAVQSPSYQSAQTLSLTYTAVMVVLLSALVVISAFKPGSPRGHKYAASKEYTAGVRGG